MNSWWFRTKPRSILKTLEWFPYFAALEGQDWNYKLEGRVSSWGNKPIFPVRRQYIFNAHSDDLEEKYASYEQYLSGQYDDNETESTGRNDKTTFEFYGLGYVDSQGKIRVTKTGQIVKLAKMDENILLKILLKIRFPSPAIHKKKTGTYVFPMEVILNIYKHFDSLNKFELGFLFMCNEIKKLDTTVNAIRDFRAKYENLDNKLDTNKVIEIFTEVMREKFPEVKNKPETYFKDYSDALIRTLEYTGLFSQRGRGYYVKLFIPEHALVKVRLLQEKFKFIYNDDQNFESYMEWFGDPYNILLPWEEESNIKFIIDNKLSILKKRLKEAQKTIGKFSLEVKLEELENQAYSSEDSKVLLELDKNLSEQLISLNEELFVKYYSKTKEAREEIIDKFVDILEGSEDMAALWLECNTWKSLVAIKGDHFVKRNFKIEEDLSPKAFAPGLGNTPDMELYKNDYILIPEVSLMTGVRQWEHEGSSVIDHVFKYIELCSDKRVFGIFLASSMNVRTLWQFYILNRESWVGKPVPVIPLTIKQYMEVIKHIYANDLDIDHLQKLIEKLHNDTFNYPTYREWVEGINHSFEEWKAQEVK